MTTHDTCAPVLHVAVRPDQAERINQLAGAEHSVSSIVRGLIEIGLFVMLGEGD